MRRPLSLLVLSFAMLGCASRPALKSASHVDLAGFMGRWYVIGYVPNVFERGKVATADEYRLRPDGEIDVTYHYRKSFQQPAKTWAGKGWLPDPADAAHWKMQLLWPLRSDYVIVDLGADGQSVLVGLPSRKLLWIMARQPTLAPAEYQRLLDVASAQGFPVGQVRRAAQRPEDVGKPGFE